MIFSLLRIFAADAWKEYKLNLDARNKEKNIGIHLFANLLVDEMMHNEESDLYSEDVRNYLPFSVTIPSGN